MTREEVRAALGAEACETLDRLREFFDAKLIYAEFSDGRSVGRKPDWADLELKDSPERKNFGPTMTDEQFREHMADIERMWGKYAQWKGRLRA